MVCMKKLIFILSLFILVTSSSFAQNYAQRFKIALDEFNQGRFIEAYTNFEKFITDYKVNDELYSEAKFYSSEALLYLNQYDNAISGYEFFLNNYNSSVYKGKAVYRLASIYFEKKNYKKCRYYLDILLNDFPYNEMYGNISYMSAQTYFEEKEYEKAITEFKKALRKVGNPSESARSYFGIAQSYQAINKYESAIKYYDTLLTYHKDSPLAYQAQMQIGLCYFKLKDFETSIVELSNPLLADESSNRYVESLYILGYSYYRSGDYANAENTFNEITSKFSGSKLERESLYGLAWAKFQQKKYAEAKELFENLASENNDTIAVNSAFRAATCMRYNGELDAAFDKYVDFLKTYSDHHLSYEANCEMGVVCFLKNNYDKAEIFFIKALESNDSTLLARAGLFLSQIKIIKHSYNEALSLLNQVTRYNNVNADIKDQAKFSLGITYYNLKSYDEAINQFNWLTVNEPAFLPDKVNFYLGECLMAQGKYQEAIDKYTGIESPDEQLQLEVNYSKGYAYFYLKDYDTAFDVFSEFVKQYPRSKKTNDVKLRIGDCYYGNKNYQAALNAYKEVINKSKTKLNNPAALYQYSEILFRAGNTDEAFEQLSNIEKLYPKTEYAYKSAYLKGWIHFKNENYSNAIEAYNEILLRYPECPIIPQVYYSLGDAYYNSEKYEEAIGNYKKIISDYPTSPYFLDAISGIQYCYEALGSPDKAAGVIDEYLAGNSASKQSDQLLYKKAEILYNARLYTQAKDNFILFLGAYPSSKLIPDVHYMLSKCYHNLDIKDEEISSLKLLINKYPESESAFNAVMDLTSIYNGKKLYDSSIAAYDAVLLNRRDLPHASEILYNKGLTLAHKGDVNAALDVFVETMQNYQGNIFSDKAMFEIALIESAAEQYEFAEKYFKNLGDTRTDELGAVSQYNYGYTLFKQKKYPEAAENFEKVLSKFSNYNEWNTKASLKLAETYTMLKEKAKAKELYRSVIKKHPKDIYGKEARQKLENLR